MWLSLSRLQFAFEDYNFAETQIVLIFEQRMYVAELQTVQQKLQCICFCERVLQLSEKPTLFREIDLPVLDI